MSATLLRHRWAAGLLDKGIKQHFDLPQSGRSFDGFMAIGDEHGLLLVFERGRSIGLGAQPPILADVFPVEAGIRAKRTSRQAVPNFPHAIFVDP